MFHQITVSTLILSGLLTLAGCSTDDWQTNYADVIDTDVSANWDISEIDVQVPPELTISERNTYAPNVDIVWRGDPYGDRYQQVDAIITEAAESASAGLTGDIPVKLVIVVSTFHALTDRTRYTLNHSGVHNISFTAQIFDAASGEELSPPDPIRADLIAFTGRQALAAERQGQTQRLRIVEHVSNVLSGWLGPGEDIRRSFTRSGR